MNPSQFTPQQSLDVITGIIQEARIRQEENGRIYMYWGIVVALVSFGDYFLRDSPISEYYFLPYFLIPLAAIGSFFFFKKKLHPSQKGNLAGNLLRTVWIFASANMMLLGFVFPVELANHLIPFLMILLGMALSISGIVLKYRPLSISGLTANLVGLGCLWLPWQFQPLAMALISISCVLVPGIMLWQAHRQRLHVQRP
ncbi:MAG: hypothetical protein NWR72_03930 [Bacteroidia bacterium]|nr:hypothetical protein [Bacteroidia bacterium]